MQGGNCCVGWVFLVIAVKYLIVFMCFNSTPKNLNLVD